MLVLILSKERKHEKFCIKCIGDYKLILKKTNYVELKILNMEMMNMIRFSIIMPVYNSSQFVEGILVDFSSHKYSDMELIAVDDGSTDDSYELCLKYSKNNPEIKVYSKKNGGPSSARNYGIKKASGRYITFIDSDDKIDFDILHQKFEQSSKRNLSLLITPFGGVKIDKLSKMSQEDVISHLILNEEINSPCNKIYLLEIINTNDIYFSEKLDLGEDLLFNMQYYFATQKLELDDKKYYTYIKHSNSLTTKFRKNKLNILLNLNDFLIKEYGNHSIQINKALNSIRIKNCYSYIVDSIVNCSIDECIYAIKQVRRKKIYRNVSNFKYKILRILLTYCPKILLIFFIKVAIFKRKKSNKKISISAVKEY